MKLQADHWVPHVRDRHDLPVVGGGRDGEHRRHAVAGDGERVVAGRLERVRQSGEDAAAVVLDAGRLAVHRPPRPHDGGAVGGADTLMAQAHAEDGRRSPEAAHHIRRDSGLAGRARARGDDDVRGSELLDLLVRRRVMASYHRLLSQLPYIARQVVHERVVVVDEQYHGSRAAIRPRALSSVSRYSCAGSESATMPPPASKYTSRPTTRQVRMTMLVSSAPVTLT